MPRRQRIPRATIIALAVTMGVVCFGIGFSLSYDDGTAPESSTEVAVTAEVSTSTTQTTVTTPTTAPPTVAPTVTTVTLPVTTVPATPATTVATAPPLPQSTVPASTPAVLDVIYPRNGDGQMVLRAGGVAAITLHNVGGSTGTFQVRGAGSVTVGATGSASGTLQPGEIRSISVVAGTNAPGAGPHATIAVFDAGGLVVNILLVISSR
jgi:hypothetical protein